MPLYYVVLAVVWFVLPTTTSFTIGDLVTHRTFTQIAVPHYFDGMLPPAWSLAFEMVYYLLVAAIGPILCHYCTRLTNRYQRQFLLLVPIALFTCSSIAAKATARRYPDWPVNMWRAHATPLQHLDAFCCGMVLAVVVAAARQPLQPRVCVVIRLAGVTLCASYPILAAAGLSSVRFTYLPAAAGFSLIAASTVLGNRRAMLVRVLAASPFQALGAWSYGLSLWHFPILQVFISTGLVFRPCHPFIPGLLVLLVAILICSGFTHRYIERPLMAQIQGLLPRRVRWAADTPMRIAQARPTISRAAFRCFGSSLRRSP